MHAFGFVGWSEQFDGLPELRLSLTVKVLIKKFESPVVSQVCFRVHGCFLGLQPEKQHGQQEGKETFP